MGLTLSQLVWCRSVEMVRFESRMMLMSSDERRERMLRVLQERRL